MVPTGKSSGRSYRPSTRGHNPSPLMPNFLFVLILCGVILLFVINALIALNVISPVIPPVLAKLAASIGGSFAVLAALWRVPGIREWWDQLIAKVEIRVVIILVALIVTCTLIFLGLTALFLLLSNTSLLGKDWSPWNPQGQWQTETVPGLFSTNILASDGSASCCDSGNIDILSPDSTPLDNYAIEAKIRILSVSSSATPGQIYFGVIIRANGEGDGNLLGMIDSSPEPQPTAFFSSIGSGQAPQFFKSYPVLDSEYHVYRIEVIGNNLKFLIDGHLMYQVKNTTYLRDARFGLVDSGYDLEVSDVSVTSLP